MNRSKEKGDAAPPRSGFPRQRPESLRRWESLLQDLESLRRFASLQRQVESLQPQTELLLEHLQTLGKIEELQRHAVTELRDIIESSVAELSAADVRSSLINRVERWLRGSLARMSDDEVFRAVEAQSPAETIAEILAAAPEARAGSENDWAELLLRGAEAKNRIAELAGGLLSSSEAATVLGISVPGVKQRLERRKLLAVSLPGGQWGFPALQFAEGGRVRAGVPEVVQAGAHVEPWTLLSILVDDVPDGSGTLLERLDDPAVLHDAVNRLQTYGEHVAA